MIKMVTKIHVLVAILAASTTCDQNELKRELNNRPIIGIPVMAITDKLLMKKRPQLKGKRYIAASYVKLIEMAGGRVVPILDDLGDQELVKIFNSINGLLFPGGEVNLEKSGYYRQTKRLLELSKKANSQGDYFPVLGICRGMQAILVHTIEDLSILVLTDARNYTSSLDWKIKDSILLRDIPDALLTSIANKNSTSHFHKYGITPNDFRNNYRLNDMFEIVATSVDRKGKEFVSIYHGKQVPFYGLQFHPEKTMFEWAETISIPHTSEAIRFSQSLVDNFMDEVRKNKHKFNNSKEERKYIISSHQPLYMGHLTHSHSPFVQIYTF